VVIVAVVALVVGVVSVLLLLLLLVLLVLLMELVLLLLSPPSVCHFVSVRFFSFMTTASGGVISRVVWVHLV